MPDNIRVTIDESGAIVTKDDYYPFGLQMDGYSHASGNPYNKLKYSGKELDEENGLYKYHFGWRDYYPELGRWVVVDPARQYASPYVFNGNTAINGYDADGRFFDPITWGIIIGATLGAYAGGSATNGGELNPTKWDYQSGETWAGMIGGGVVGGFTGGHMAFQMFGSSAAGATGVTFTGSVTATAGAATGGASASVVAGGASSGVFSYGVFGAVGVGGATAYAAYSIYNNGLGTPNGESGTQWDFTYGAYYTRGSGNGAYMPIYTLNSNTLGGLNGYQNSITYGQMYTYNSAIGEWTGQAHFGFRSNNISFFYHNDVQDAPAYSWFGPSTDQGWTGGGMFSMNQNGRLSEWGTEVFTGKKISNDMYFSYNGYNYYKQDPYQMSLNRALTFGRFNSGAKYGYDYSGWSQNMIHDPLGIHRFWFGY